MNSSSVGISIVIIMGCTTLLVGGKEKINDASSGEFEVIAF
jgi:hypothetical protein